MVDYTNLSDSTSITILALNEGSWGSNLKVHLHNFDDDEGTYELDVYLRKNGYDHLKERWYVSHNYQLDGYGKQLHAESRINGKSQFIEVVINRHSSAHPLPLHRIYGEDVGFTGHLQKVFQSTQFSIVPGTLIVESNAPGALKMYDDGKGNLSGPAGSGIINYETGAYQIALAFGSAGFATYDYESYLSLSGGADGVIAAEEEILEALNEIKESDLEFELLVEPYYRSAEIQQAMVEVCEFKGYPIAILNVPAFESVQDFRDWRRLLSVNSSFACYAYPSVLIRTNNEIIEMPVASLVAANLAFVASQVGPGIAVAGETTGLIECIGVKDELSEDLKNELFDNHINYVESNDLTGATLMTEFTAQVADSLVSRISVRRVVNTIRKMLEIFSESVRWKINSEELRNYISQRLMSNFAILKQTSNIQGYHVTCDGSNNSESDSETVLRIDVTIVPMDSVLRIKWSIALNQSGDVNINNFL